MNHFHKVLIANRGEIAVRIIRTLHQRGIMSVVVYSHHDRDALFVRMARESYLLEGDEPAQTYLNLDKIMEVARRAGCDAIHPGYGFLSENPALAAACQQAGITFIGPSAEVIALMGDKLRAHLHVAGLGLPVIPRIMLSIDHDQEPDPGMFPVMVKAVAGGGGKGMRLVKNPEDLEAVISQVQREAQAYFGDNRVYIEKHLDQVRHIEVQVLGDGRGNAIHLFERECTIQRRHQKIIEEAPSPSLTEEQRQRVCSMAVEIARSVNYSGAGTLEFLLQGEKDFYFLEMNTRLQVEHPVTEMITGRDLVADQLDIAMHHCLPARQQQITMNGHAIEVRLYAEDPEDDFFPSPGPVVHYRESMGRGIRVDSALDGPARISDRYDPMAAKLIVHADDRPRAIEKMAHALSDFRITGIRNNIEYLMAVMNHQPYIQNNLDTSYCAKHHQVLLEAIRRKRETIPLAVMLGAYAVAASHQKTGRNHAVAQAIGYWRQQPFFRLETGKEQYHLLLNKTAKSLNIYIENDVYAFESITCEQHRVGFSFNQQDYRVDYVLDGSGHLKGVAGGISFEVKNALTAFQRPHVHVLAPGSPGEDTETLLSPMHGKVIQVRACEQQQVRKGDILMVIEAMKMENNIIAPQDGQILKVNATEGTQVEKDMPLIIMQ